MTPIKNFVFGLFSKNQYTTKYTIIYKCKNKNCLIDLGPSTYTSRMAGFVLFVSNTTSKENGHPCFHEIQTVKGTPSENQRINCSVNGSYVIYYN